MPEAALRDGARGAEDLKNDPKTVLNLRRPSKHAKVDARTGSGARARPRRPPRPP